MIFASVGYASKDSRAKTWLRLDRQFSIHQTEPLTHADKAEPPTIDRLPPIETHSWVSDNQTNAVPSAVHFHREFLRAAMLYSILQSFLKDSK